VTDAAEIIDLDAARKEQKRKYHREYMRRWTKENAKKHRESSRISMAKQRETNGDRVNRIRRESYARRWVTAALGHAKQRAQKKGWDFALSAKDIIVPEFCPILGIRLQVGDGAFSDSSPSLDRINPNLGYVPGNVAVISMRANAIKRDGSAAEHERIAAWMRANGVA